MKRSVKLHRPGVPSENIARTRQYHIPSARGAVGTCSVFADTVIEKSSGSRKVGVLLTWISYSLAPVMRFHVSVGVAVV